MASLPHIDGYIDFLRLYSVAGFGQLPVADWSLGFLMGGVYAVSLAAVLALRAARGRGELGRAPRAIVPLAAVSTLGAVSLSYFLGRSHPERPHARRAAVRRHGDALDRARLARVGARPRPRSPRCGVALAGRVRGISSIAQQLPELAAKAPDSALVAAVARRDRRAAPGLRHLVRAADRPAASSARRTRTVEALVRAHVPRSRAAARGRRAGRGDRDARSASTAPASCPSARPSRTGSSPQRRRTLLRQAAGRSAAAPTS